MYKAIRVLIRAAVGPFQGLADAGARPFLDKLIFEELTMVMISLLIDHLASNVRNGRLCCCGGRMKVQCTATLIAIIVGARECHLRS